MFQFILPDPCEGLQEADITQWLVKEGDEVEVNDLLVEIETAKSLVELPSPVAGKISRLLADVGETVDVGTVIVEIDDGSETAADAPEPLAVNAPQTPATQPSSTGPATVTPTGKVLAKPLVRRLARDLGVDLFHVHPTGPHGSVSRRRRTGSGTWQERIQLSRSAPDGRAVCPDRPDPGRPPRADQGRPQGHRG